MTPFTKSVTEQVILEWPKDLGYIIVFGSDIAPKNTLTSQWDGLSLYRVMRGEVRVIGNGLERTKRMIVDFHTLASLCKALLPVLGRGKTRLKDME